MTLQQLVISLLVLGGSAQKAFPFGASWASKTKPSHLAQQAGRYLAASDADAYGGLYGAEPKTTCDVQANAIKDAEVCSMDEFVFLGKSAANVLECIFISSNQFLIGAAEQMRRVEEKYVKSPELTVTFDHFSNCSDDAMMYYNETRAGRKARHVDVVLIPQPPSPQYSTAYAFNGAGAAAKLASLDIDKINKDLSFATAFSVVTKDWLGSYQSKGKMYNTIDLAYYIGNDPATVYFPGGMLGPESGAVCGAGFPEANFYHRDSASPIAGFYSGNLPSNMPKKKDGTPIMRPWWSSTYGDYLDPKAKLLTSGGMAVLDSKGKFQGALHVDFNIAFIREFLDNLKLTPNAYGLVVSSDGGTIAANQKAIDTIFFPNMSLVELRGGTAYANCGDLPKDQQATCSEPKTLPITDAAKSRFSGANFTQVLTSMFDPKHKECSIDMNLLSVQIGNQQHLVFFCALSHSIPGWGIIVGTPKEEVSNAAIFSLALAPGQEAKVSRENDGDTDHIVTFDVVLQNNGRFALPYRAQLDKNAPWLSLAQGTNNTLAPKASVTLQIEMDTKRMAPDDKHSLHSAVLEVKSDELVGRGYCFRQAETITVTFANNIPPDNTVMILAFILAGVALVASSVALAWFARWVCKNRTDKIRLFKQREVMLRKRLVEGVQTVKSLAHPMVLISATPFLNLSWDHLKTLHEGVRNSGQLLFLDSADAIDGFKDQGYTIVFFSYQWLSWTSPGPTEVQLSCMKRSLEKLCATKEIAVDKVVVWLDILAIPQRCDGVKGLAVNSLYTYARYADILLIVAPATTHEALKTPAGKTSYKKRIWCRTEQLAFFCNQGIQGMFLTEEPGMLEDLEEDWLDDITMMFDGEMTCCSQKHPDNAACDKLSIVTPLIGMYFDVYVKKTCGILDETAAATWKFIDNRKHLIFPNTFMYNFQKQDDEVFEERELFGDMIKRVEEFVAEDLDAAKALSSTIKTKAFHTSARVSARVILPIMSGTASWKCEGEVAGAEIMDGNDMCEC